MLHLLAGLNVIGPSAAFGGPQPGLAHQASEGAIAHLKMMLITQEFLKTDDIAPATRKQGLDQDQEVLIPIRLLARDRMGLPTHPAHRAA